MKPAPFDYFAPATVEEAVALLEQNGEEAKVLAGGQSLVPLLNFRLVRPKALIDFSLIKPKARPADIEVVSGALPGKRPQG